MNKTIFDLVQEDIPEGKEGFFEIASRAPEPKDNSFLSSVSDYGKTILKGGVEGILRFGRMVSPTPGLQEEDLKGKQAEALDKILPTEEGFIQSAIRRGLREAPTALSFPGSKLATLTRAMLAGFFGEGAKELGLPEWAQTAAELTAYIGPDITKKLLEQGKNKDLIKKAKELGISDEQITPLIQSEFKQKWLSKVSTKAESTQQALKKTKSGLSQAYNTLQKSDIAKREISEIQNGKLIERLQQQLDNMPSNVRSKISEDVKDLLGNKITGESLINFYGDVNHNLGPGSRQLSLLNDPVKEAIASLSPQLANDFNTINKMYERYYHIAGRLKSTLSSEIMSVAENLGILGALGGVTLGYYPPLVTILGEKAGRKLAQQMLINPKFQQLSQKMINAVNENKFQIAKEITNQFSKEIKKFDEKIGEKFEDISEEDLKNLFKSNH